MSDIEETAIADEEVPEEEEPQPLEDTAKETGDEAAEEAGGGSGRKPFIVYYNALSRVAMAAFLIAGGTYAIPDVWLTTPTQNFQYCGKQKILCCIQYMCYYY